MERCYGGGDCDWGRFSTPRFERGNFASRYHLVYPALAYFIRLARRPDDAAGLRPHLDALYRGLVSERCWSYWHGELGETSGAIAERNLTYAGRLALFVGLYLAAFGEPPSPRIEVDGESVTYQQLSARLHRQMTVSPSGGVSCYHHESMVMCNAVLLDNNLLHDRLFGTGYADANAAWLDVVAGNLVADPAAGPLFFYGTEPDSPRPQRRNRSLGADAWALFLLSASAPTQTRRWFEQWRHHLRHDDGRAWLPIGEKQAEAELASVDVATAWTLCLAAELGDRALHRALDAFLSEGAVAGFPVDPYTTGLYALGHELRPGSFRRLVAGA
jgi:hypothetical protein